MKQIKTIQINLRGCDYDCISNKIYCDEFLKSLVKEVKMRLIPEKLIGTKNPVTFIFSGKGIHPEDAGVTGTATLYESHAAIHTWPNLDGFACVVLTSCKEFDSEKVSEWVKKCLRAESYDFQTIEINNP